MYEVGKVRRKFGKLQIRLYNWIFFCLGVYMVLFLSFSVYFSAEFDGRTEVKPHCARTFRWETASPKSRRAAPPSAAPPEISAALPALQTTPSRTSSGLAATTVSSLRSRFFLLLLIEFLSVFCSRSHFFTRFQLWKSFYITITSCSASVVVFRFWLGWSWCAFQGSFRRLSVSWIWTSCIVSYLFNLASYRYLFRFGRNWNRTCTLLYYLCFSLFYGSSIIAYIGPLFGKLMHGHFGKKKKKQIVGRIMTIPIITSWILLIQFRSCDLCQDVFSASTENIGRKEKSQESIAIFFLIIVIRYTNKWYFSNK